MTRFSMSLSRALKAEIAVRELIQQIESELGGPSQVAGGLILATAGAGRDGRDVAEGLADRWPDATFLGTSFEGILAAGRSFRDEPAYALLSWPEGPFEPIPLVFGPDEQDAARIADAILGASGRSTLTTSDLVLLFPDALGSYGLEPILERLGALLGPASLAGAAATGVDGHPAQGFVGGEARDGALIGLFVPGEDPDADVGERRPRVRAAGGSRSASPWLEITNCRARWVDGLDDEPPLDWVRRQLGLDANSPIEPHLDRLLVRIRRPRADSGGQVADTGYEERYVVGVDNQRGAISLPGTFRRGDELAFALPDAAYARETLRIAIDALESTPFLLQFACRARDEALHGDPELESAWVAHHAPERHVLGTISPFQLATSPGGVPQILVHATVLAAFGQR